MRTGLWITTFALALVAAFSLQSAPEDAAESAGSRVTVSELRLIRQLREMAQPPDSAALRTVELFAPLSSKAAVAIPAAAPAVRGEAASETLVVTAEALNLREQPSSDAPVLGRLEQGQQVVASRRDGGWIEVAAADGATGWAYGKYLAETAPN